MNNHVAKTNSTTSTTEQGHLISLTLDTPVSCPECGHTFPLRDGLGQATIAQLEARQAEFLSAREQELEDRLEKERKAASEKAEKERQRLSKEYEAKLKATHENSRRLGLEQAKAEQSETLSQLTAQLEASRKQANQHAKLLQQAEMAKLEMEEKLQSQTHTMQVALKKETNKLRKQLEAEYEKNSKSLLAEALEDERSKAALKLKAAEVEKAQLLGKVEKLHQQLEQRSQQVQGEALENLLEERLAALCPEDGIETIKAGAAGEDVLHSVYDENGTHVGNISWEYKYRKNWSPRWLSKLAKDARNSEASAAVLVTTVLPADMEGKVAYIDGCWVCSVDAWEGLALVLRAQVLEVARLSTSLEQREDKASRAYEYLQSEKFRSSAMAMLNTLADMEAQVTREERAFAKQWKQRREQIRTISGLHTDHTETIAAITAQDILADEFLGEEDDAA